MIEEMREWQLAAAEFGANYKCNVTVAYWKNASNEGVSFELSHEDDPKNVVKYKKDGIYCHPKQRREGYFEALYDRLPIVRRNRRA